MSEAFRWFLVSLASFALALMPWAPLLEEPSTSDVAAPRISAGVGVAARSAGSAPLDLNHLQLSLEQVAQGLAQPTHLAAAGDGSGRLFIVEKAGRILILGDGEVLSRPFLDIRSLVGSQGSEQGLFSVAFHSRYRENGRLLVNYTDVNGDTVIAQYSVSSDPNLVLATSASVLLRIRQPAPNHNGGLLLFGPDGYLYIGMGDGGGAGDVFGNAQNLSSLLGKMLRIDVDGGTPYSVPADNPFLRRSGVRPEIWAYGLRNPWRYSFDRATGHLFIADVGQNRYEEVHLQPANRGGQNYGWPVLEGTHCYPSDPCNRTGLELPILEYSHDLGCSITGGGVYRGPEAPRAHGAYIFGDFCSGRIWAAAAGPDGRWGMRQLLHTSLLLSSFGEDEQGELYAASLSGTIHRLRLQSVAPTTEPTLSPILSPTVPSTATSIPSPTAPSTATSTTLPSATRTAIPSGTATLAPVRTATPSPLPTGTRGLIGGRGFTLSASPVAMGWMPGTDQAGYVMIRFSPSRADILPPGGSLPAGATTFVDLSPLSGLSCYLLFPFGGTPVRFLGNSDLLCRVSGIQSPVGAPEFFSIQLNESALARVTWAAPLGGGQDGYVLFPLGGTPRFLGPGESQASQVLDGPTCFVLTAITRGGPLGTTNALCGLPGLARFAAPFG